MKVCVNSDPRKVLIKVKQNSDSWTFNPRWLYGYKQQENYKDTPSIRISIFPPIFILKFISAIIGYEL